VPAPLWRYPRCRRRFRGRKRAPPSITTDMPMIPHSESAGITWHWQRPGPASTHAWAGGHAPQHSGQPATMPHGSPATSSHTHIPPALTQAWDGRHSPSHWLGEAAVHGGVCAVAAEAAARTRNAPRTMLRHDCRSKQSSVLMMGCPPCVVTDSTVTNRPTLAAHTPTQLKVTTACIMMRHDKRHAAADRTKLATP
jgi:hypothetical protein